MKSLLHHFGRLQLLALVITALPLIMLPLMGALWLWQSGLFWYWLGLLTVSGAGGYGLHRLLIWRAGKGGVLGGNQRPTTQAGSHWPPAADQPWEAVSAMADQVNPKDWPLADGARLWQLGRDTLEAVARHYHPQRENPLLEMTLPHALLIIERASHELRHRITDHVPFSHRLTLGTVSRAKLWKEHFSRLEGVYRIGYGIVDPTSVLFREFRREMGNRILGYGSEQVQTWLLQEYVRKVGYYAIELYSGQLLLTEDDGATPVTRRSRAQVKQAAASEEPQQQTQEPLRILVLGRRNAGKSSLINGLFGELKAADDVLADTTHQVTVYSLQREGLTQALVLDTPGLDTPQFSARALRHELAAADLVLWVTAANRPDRQQERMVLDEVRGWLQQDHSRRPPPMLFVLSHIDRLRPFREWAPPYDLKQGGSAKADGIIAAARAAADDLALDPGALIPVCLQPERLYNLEDALWAAILGQQDEALRVRLLRCVSDRRQRENWGLLKQQLTNAGRLLAGNS
ncbi:MAG: GTP-binding protein HSR1 [Halomonadaceae bacterium]|nr:MAG: GTP-binding protein HSR1 [Halomonadaceae bacterium]